jgi:hypothetical protein
MNKFYLPKLEKMTIVDYTLYTSPFIIDFKKLNIVFGTNGTGKSTLLLIILFSIIGPYRGGIKTKNWKDKRKDNRPIYVEDFFKDRMVDDNVKAKVKMEFRIHEDEYIVEHSLEDGKLLDVYVNSYRLDGKIVNYRTYEGKHGDSREIDSDDEENLKDYLIYKYHNEIKKSTCLPGGINTLISMLLDVMFFDEERKFTFWQPNLQETVIGKYIVDAEFYTKFCNKKLHTKSLENIYKKNSETYNYMNKFFKKEKEKVEINPEVRDYHNELSKIEKEIFKLENSIEEEAKQFTKRNENLLNVTKEVEEIREKIKNLEDTWYNNLFPSQYNTYYKRFNGKMIDGICPICEKAHVFTVNTENCIFCEEKLDIKITPNLVKVDIERKNKQILLVQKNTEIDNIRLNLRKLNKSIETQKSRLSELEIKKNQIELEINIDKNVEDDSDSMRLNRALEERNIALKNFNESKKEQEEMRKVIEKSLVNNFNEFSSTFKKYGYSFFGNNHKINLRLPFSGDGDSLAGMMIKFELDEKSRDESYMLSESQRIFTDLAFRFSILTTFHEKSFFMCETPDSTLDMFHENNAVNTFMEYINSGNCLILTANVRRSNLISKLYKKYEESEINVIDLTKISKLALSERISFEDYLGGDNNG